MPLPITTARLESDDGRQLGKGLSEAREEEQAARDECQPLRPPARALVSISSSLELSAMEIQRARAALGGALGGRALLELGRSSVPGHESERPDGQNGPDAEQ